MGVGDFEIFQDALDRAVLAERPVQRVEGDVGLELGQDGGDVAADIDPRDAIAFRFQRIGAGFPDDRDTGRSDENPPIRTATCLLPCPVIPLVGGPTTCFTRIEPAFSGEFPDGKRGPTPRNDLNRETEYSQRIRTLIRWQDPAIRSDSLSSQSLARMHHRPAGRTGTKVEKPDSRSPACPATTSGQSLLRCYTSLTACAPRRYLRPPPPRPSGQRWFAKRTGEGERSERTSDRSDGSSSSTRSKTAGASEMCELRRAKWGTAPARDGAKSGSLGASVTRGRRKRPPHHRVAAASASCASSVSH